jgi:hypothetical protein
MNGEPANKSYKIEAYNLEEKSFQSFHSSATSLIKGEISRNEIKFTPLSHRRNKSSNTLSNSHIDNMIANAENSINYFQELDQPGNKPIKFDLQKLYNLNRAAKKLNKDYEKLKRYLIKFYNINLDQNHLKKKLSVDSRIKISKTKRVLITLITVIIFFLK